MRRAMFWWFVLIVLLCVGCGRGQVQIPATPAGQTLQAWLDAFNSGDRAKIESYIKTTDSTQTADSMMGFGKQTGGFDLLSIESSEPLLITFKVKEKASPTVAFGSLQLKTAQPAMVESLSLRTVPAGVAVENIKLDAVERQRVIDGVAAKLTEYYVYPELAQKMNEAMVAHQKSGAYDALTDGSAFAGRLTKDLRDVSHDRHLRVDYSPFKLPPDRDGPSSQDMERMKARMEHDNCGFEKVEILPRNIGYVKFNMFADPKICGPTVAAAMDFIAHTDAVIFDLRDNGGGDPQMVALIATYLFDGKEHLNDLYDRKSDKTTQFWTQPSVPGTKLGGAKPVYLLTSSRTFSGAEEFTYDLKNLKRATIVGETTGGGAHPVRGMRVDDHFIVGVPFARAINPVSKTDWEGTGVEPDVPVKSADALEAAQKLAEAKLLVK
jgi:retinol-binding protein 3